MIKIVALIDLHIVLAYKCCHCLLVFNIWMSHALEIAIHFYYPTLELFCFSFIYPTFYSLKILFTLFSSVPPSAINNDRALRKLQIDRDTTTWKIHVLESLYTYKDALSISFSVESVNNTNLTNRAMQLCRNLPEEDMVKNLSIHTIENQMTTAMSMTTLNPNVTSMTTLNPNATSMTTLDIGTTPTCCGASRLSAMGHILVVFIVWFFLGSFAK